MHGIDDQLGGQLALVVAEIVLAKESQHDFTHLLLDADLREEILAAQHPSAAHADQVHAGSARVDHGGDHIHVAAAALHALLILHTTQDGDLVAQHRSLLEVQAHGGLLHSGSQFLGQRIAAPFKEHRRMAHILGILLGAHEADARPLAALDLVLQARPGAVAEVAVLALPHEERLLQQVETLANRTCAGIRPEVATFLLLRATMDGQSRVLVLAGEEHVGIRLVVAQQDVVRRPPFLDQRLLEQQRLGFVGGDGGLDLGDLRHQCGGLRRQAGLAEIAGEPLLEVLRLADVEQPGVHIEHAVDARPPAAGGQECSRVEPRAHFSVQRRPCRGARPTAPARHRW
ncbi:hypothetical protein D3C76_432150 [compost metagenome]